MKFLTKLKKGYIVLVLAVLVFGSFVAYATSATIGESYEVIVQDDSGLPSDKDFVAGVFGGVSELPDKSLFSDDFSNSNQSQESFVVQDLVTTEVVVERKDGDDERIIRRDERQSDRHDDDNEEREDREEREGDDD